MMLSMVPMAFADDSDEYSAYVYADYGCDMSTVGAVYDEEVASAITADASWLDTYDEESNSYTISTVDQLFDFLVNNPGEAFENGSTVFLVNSIYDLGGLALTPLYSQRKCSLEGRGATILNLHAVADINGGYVISTSGSLSNITFKNSTVGQPTSIYTRFVVSSEDITDVTFENCKILRRSAGQNRASVVSCSGTARDITFKNCAICNGSRSYCYAVECDTAADVGFDHCTMSMQWGSYIIMDPAIQTTAIQKNVNMV